MDRALRLEVLNTSPRAGTGFTAEEAADRGQMKNHWRWQVLVKGDGDKRVGVTFGFGLDETPSVESNVAQYAASSQAESKPGSSGDRFSKASPRNIAWSGAAVILPRSVTLRAHSSRL